MSQRTQVQRPTSSPSPQSSRKVFNCIVDDTALVAGVKRSTRNGLRQWIKNGQIRLFVPLHVLEQLSEQKGGASRHADDVRETLDWLDQATTKFPDAVTLQGGDETFQQWSEVEKFIIPRSLFSEYDHEEAHAEESADSHVATGSTTPTSPPSSSSPMAFPSPPISPVKDAGEGEPCKDNKHDGVPVWLQPLYNYILWRIHQEIDPVAALESFIFLCNDSLKVDLAKGFGVRCKRLEQLRDAVSREERDFKNRQTVQHRSTHSTSSLPDQPGSPLSRSPPIAPAAMLKEQANVIDPDAFDRSIKVPKSPVIPQASRGNHSNGSSSRGRGSMRGRGRGSAIPMLGRVDLAIINGRGRGGDGVAESGAQIDPNSFERPRGDYSGRGGRRLWTPG